MDAQYRIYYTEILLNYTLEYNMYLMNKVILAIVLTGGITALAYMDSPFNKQTLKRWIFHICAVVFTILSGIFFPIPATAGDELLVTTGLLTFTVGFVLIVSAKMEINQVQKQSFGKKILVKSGPFSVTRNPIYVGALLTFFGTAVALKSYGVLIGFYYIYHIIEIVRKEELLLEKQFGMEFVAYKSKVPRFVPFFWK